MDLRVLQLTVDDGTFIFLIIYLLYIENEMTAAKSERVSCNNFLYLCRSNVFCCCYIFCLIDTIYGDI